MRDFSKDVAENKNLENSIEVAKTIRDKALKEMARDVYDILSEIYNDGTKYVNYVTEVCIKQDSDLWKKGLHTFFFRNDSNGHFINVNKISVTEGERRVTFNGISIDVDDDSKAYGCDRTTVSDYQLKDFFKELDSILKVGKDDLVGVAEYTIEKKLESDKASLLKTFNNVSCSTSE